MSESKYKTIYIESASENKDSFLVPKHFYNDIDSVLLSHGLIMDRIEKLAYDINKHFENKELHALCLLKGSRAYFTSLFKFLNKFNSIDGNPRVPCFFEHYIRVKSYLNDKSSNTVKIFQEEELHCLEGKDVLIVEDIIDSGLSLTYLCDYLKKKVKPASITVTALLEKRTARSNGFKGDYVGFSIPDMFLIGFGLDYNDYFRDLPHICAISQTALQKYRCQK